MPSPSVRLIVGPDHAIPVEPQGGRAIVTVDSTDGPVYYSTDPGVNATNNQGSIAGGGSQTFTQNAWLFASAASGVNVAVTSVWDEWSGVNPDPTQRFLPANLPTSVVSNSQLSINVKSPAYGAKGDGVTDDRVACQAAIDAAHNTYLATGTPVEVYFPPGTYYVSHTLVQAATYVYPCLTIRSGVVIEGRRAARLLMQPMAVTTTTSSVTTPVTSLPVTSTAGFDSTLTLPNLFIYTAASGTMTPAFTVASATSFNTPSGWPNGIVIPSGTKVEQDTGWAGIVTDSPVGSGTGGVTCDNWAIHGMIIDGNNPTGFENAFNNAILVGNASNWSITDCEITQNLGKPIFSYPQTSHVNSHWQIERNNVHDAWGNAISVDGGGYDFSISNNDIHDIRELPGGAESIFLGTTSQRATVGNVSDNRIRSWGTVDITGDTLRVDRNLIDCAPSQQGPALRVHGGTDLKVRDNTLDMSQSTGNTAYGFGVQTAGYADLEVSNNTIISNGADAININTGTYQRVTVSGNRLSQVNSSATGGAVTIGGATDLTVADNHMDISSTATILMNLTGLTRYVVTGNVLSNVRLITNGASGVVSGNVVIVPSTGTPAALTAMTITGDAVVSGNIVSGNGNAVYGMLNLDNAFDCLVVNNKITAVTTGTPWIGETTGSDRNTYKLNKFLGTGTHTNNITGTSSDALTFPTTAESGLTIIRGRISATATIVSGSGFTVSSSATGQYDIVYSKAFSGIPTVLLTNETSTGYDALFLNLEATTGFRANINLQNAAANGAFAFVAIGPA